VLDGQKLIRFSFTTEKLLCVFESDLGGTISTVRYDKKGEQWVLFTPEQKILTLRADRRYRYMPPHLPNDKGVWKPGLN
jgi:hypothetical protein